MKNIDKAKEIVNSNASLLDEWLERARKVRQLEPYVRQAYENTIWQRDSLNAIPEDAPDLEADVVITLENSRNVLKTYLPRIEKALGRYSNPITFNATLASGSTSTFTYLTEISDDLSPAQKDRIKPYIYSYVELHQRQDRISNVKAILAKLDQELVVELKLAETDLLHFKNGTSDVVAPAAALRNVLQHFKGKLLLKARNSPKDTPNWSSMADRLVITSVSTPEHSTLLGQESTYSKLYDRLSRILKGNIQITSSEMENIYIELVDHFYVVIPLVRI